MVSRCYILWNFHGLGLFCESLNTRFGPSAYDNPMEALTQLKQTTTIVAYNAQLERLSNRLKGLSKRQIKLLF